MGRYSQSLGIVTTPGYSPLAPTKLGDVPSDFTNWGISKMPAVAGSYMAIWAYNWANEQAKKRKWFATRGAEFIGAVGVVIIAYALDVLTRKFKPDWARMADHFTDGMIGRAGPVIARVTGVEKLLPEGFKSKPANALDAPANDGGAAQGFSSVSLDGDRQATMGAAELWANSPESTASMANAMYEIMRDQGVEGLDEQVREHMVQSFREASNLMARGEI